MSKQLLFTDMWIPVSEDRLPPDDHEEVLLYNSKMGLIFTYTGHTARQMFDKNWANKNAKGMSGGFEFRVCEITHWMPVFPPEGGIASCEYYRNAVPKWKRNSTQIQSRRRS